MRIYRISILLWGGESMILHADLSFLVRSRFDGCLDRFRPECATSAADVRSTGTCSMQRLADYYSFTASALRFRIYDDSNQRLTAAIARVADPPHDSTAGQHLPAAISPAAVLRNGLTRAALRLR